MHLLLISPILLLYITAFAWIAGVRILIEWCLLNPETFLSNQSFVSISLTCADATVDTAIPYSVAITEFESFTDSLQCASLVTPLDNAMSVMSVSELQPTRVGRLLIVNVQSIVTVSIHEVYMSWVCSKAHECDTYWITYSVYLQVLHFFCDCLNKVSRLYGALMDLQLHWPSSIHKLNLYAICWCSLKPLTVAEICQYIKFKILRQFMHSHDYYALVEGYIVKRRTVILLILNYWLFYHGMCSRAHRSLLREDITKFSLARASELDVELDVGGGKIPVFFFKDLQPYVQDGNNKFPENAEFRYAAHKHSKVTDALYRHGQDCDYIHTKFPLNQFVAKGTMKNFRSIAKSHNIYVPSKAKIDTAALYLKDHHCSSCETHVTVFAPHIRKSNSLKCKNWYAALNPTTKSKRIKDVQTKNEAKVKKKEKISPPLPIQHPFPPPPPSIELKETVVRNWCHDSLPENFTESGCAVCGQLVPVKQLKKLSETECDIDILNREGMGVTRQERFSNDDPILEIKGPVLDHECTKICRSCENSLSMGLTPKYALANGLWLGAIPRQLQNLSFTEQLLISRVHRNKCIVRASSGMHKMKCNAIMFENPIPKIYQRLPPSIDDLDDVLAFIFTGPCHPTPKDLERTPLLVRRRKVAEALEWLKLNHTDYFDLDIAYDNLEAYPEKGPPVIITYRNADGNKEPEATSAFDNEEEDGVEDGPCPFVVNGVMGEELESLSLKAMIAKAAKHLREDNGGVLAIGHSAKPQSIYNNPQLYPMMFPFLFPYGLGGICSVNSDAFKMSDMMHKRRLLMYHDKRFQTDAYFPLVAFNHEQIKKSTTGGYLLTEKHNFHDIADRLMNIDTSVLEDLSKRLS